MSEPRIEIRQVPEASRFEILADGTPAGVATYSDDGNVRTFIHTEIDSSHEGEGLGGKLVRGALDRTREAGFRVVPKCPFVKSFIEQNPGYADLVAGEPSR